MVSTFIYKQVPDGLTLGLSMAECREMFTLIRYAETMDEIKSNRVFQALQNELELVINPVTF